MQNIQQVHEGTTTKKFFHPYMQTLTMFVGECSCLVVYLLLKSSLPVKQPVATDKKPPLPKMLLVVPACFDLLGSLLLKIGLNFMPGSVFQMMRAGSIVTTALFSYLLVGKTLKHNQVVGCSLALVGVFIIGAANMLLGVDTAKASSGTVSLIQNFRRNLLGLP